MLVFGSIVAFPADKGFIPVNFTGMNQTVQRLSFNNLNIDIYSPDFDQIFAEIIYNNDDNFLQLFDIIQLLNAGVDIFICTSHQEVAEMLNEALAKFIQQRYGYNYQMVNCSEDIDYFDDSYFTTTGLYNYDLDKERYISIKVNRGDIQ